MSDRFNRRTPDTDQQSEGGHKNFGRSNWLWIIAVVMLGWLFLTLCVPARAGMPISFTAFVEQARAGNVASVTIRGQEVTGEFVTPQRFLNGRLLAPEETTGDRQPTTSQQFQTVIPPDSAPLVLPLLQENNVVIQAEPEGDGLLPTLLLTFLPWLLFLGIIIYFWNRMAAGGGQQQGIFNFARSKARLYDAERPTVTFADVAGEEEAKQALTQVVDFLKRPGRYHSLGARLPRGVLLVGPPGTGKTLLARAVAGEAGVPFFSISAAEFVELFVGVGASRVRDLFAQAKKNSPAIIFVDELDAVGRQRGAGLGGGNDEREQTLNQLLTEMDGFEQGQEVIVIAATNRPDVLDPALLRPGRFDRQVTVGLPDRRGREAILGVHMRGIPLGATVNVDSLAAITPGFSGADLANLVNEAALVAARANKKVVEQNDFDVALDQIVLGAERPLLLSDHDKRVIAYHEAGHALVAYLTPGSDPLRKISIVPRGRALGVTVQAPEGDRYNYSRAYLRGRLAVMMGGRVAEEMEFGEITTGAQNDLKEATELARRMVGLWGMSEEIGPVFLGMGEQHVFLGREMTQERTIGDQALNRADAAVRHLLEQARQEAETVLGERRALLDRLAATLIAEETLDQAQIQDLLGLPPVSAAPEGVAD